MTEPAKTEDKGKDPANTRQEEPEETKTTERFPPEEEAACKQSSLVKESNDKKAEANALFTAAKYENAITRYEEATALCPHYLDYELAVLKSNIAACHLKLAQYKDAITVATASLDALARVEKAEFGSTKEKDAEKEADEGQVEEEEADEEIVSTGAQNSAQPESDARRRRDDIARIRAKALLRRARARAELGGWANLSAAEEDYKLLATMDNLGPADARTVRAQLRSLGPRAKAAQEEEMAQMWGKLKDLGNGILSPFGLSTDNFKMTKDEKTGGYSMNFSQN
ncbi:hypothetical protein F4780DRAFT_777570 [Xylariomycetidae sp. FL0641]|nr:hypothetical protein F4780DRAFT_777570 [Xylariomycetidae sp. FL0641]